MRGSFEFQNIISKFFKCAAGMLVYDFCSIVFPFSFFCVCLCLNIQLSRIKWSHLRVIKIAPIGINRIYSCAIFEWYRTMWAWWEEMYTWACASILARTHADNSLWSVRILLLRIIILWLWWVQQVTISIYLRAFYSVCVLEL